MYGSVLLFSVIVETYTSLLTKFSCTNHLLEKGMIVGGMIPKLDNAFAALENGVAEVFIKHADNLLNNKETLLQL